MLRPLRRRVGQVKLNELTPGRRGVKGRKRVGRGAGSGHGKRCCRGNKGQKARNKVSIWFEGGQMPLQRRVPKRGFKNPTRKAYEVVNLGSIAKRFVEGEEVNPETLMAKRLIRKKASRVKILANGELSFPVKITAHSISAKAKEIVEKAGGAVTLVE
jgi:large subunit ribosomal protein L15